MCSRFYLLPLALIGLLLSACLPESKNPLSLPSTSVVDSRLEGALRAAGQGQKEDAGYWHFHYRGVHAEMGRRPARRPGWKVLTVEPAKDGGLKTHRYEALATRLAGMIISASSIFRTKAGSGRACPYSFARYEVNWRGDLHVWIADDKAFAAAVKAGKLRGQVSHSQFGDEVGSPDTTEHLAAFVAASDPKVLFSSEPMVMRRLARRGAG